MAYATDDVRAETKIGRYKARILKTDAGVKVDVREFIESARYTGFTQKGIRMTLEEFKAMLGFVGDSLAKELGEKPVTTSKPSPAVPKAIPASVPAVSLADIVDATVDAVKPLPEPPVSVPAPRVKLSDAQVKADISGPSVADLRARSRRGEVIPITGPGSLAEAIARDKARKAKVS